MREKWKLLESSEWLKGTHNNFVVLRYPTAVIRSLLEGATNVPLKGTLGPKQFTMTITFEGHKVLLDGTLVALKLQFPLPSGSPFDVMTITTIQIVSTPLWFRPLGRLVWMLQTQLFGNC